MTHAFRLVGGPYDGQVTVIQSLGGTGLPLVYQVRLPATMPDGRPARALYTRKRQGRGMAGQMRYIYRYFLTWPIPEDDLLDSNLACT